MLRIDELAGSELVPQAEIIMPTSTSQSRPRVPGRARLHAVHEADTRPHEREQARTVEPPPPGLAMSSSL